MTQNKNESSMSYTYLRDAGEESSAASFSDIEQSAPWKSNPTAGESCCNDSEMESCRDSQSGMMCKPSMADRGMESLISCAEDSPARICQRRVTELELMGRALAFGEKCSESSVRFDRASHSWKTHQCLFEEVLPESSVTLPMFGMMRGGVLLDAGVLALRMTAKERGCSLGTPTATMSHRSKKFLENSDRLPTPREAVGGKTPHPEWIEWLMGWPIGMTATTPLETGKFRQWLHSFGNCWGATN